jgi:DUF971 family protein
LKIEIMPEDAFPTALKLTDDRALLISWSNGETRKYPFKLLRDSCPCASCREKARGKADAPANPFAILTPAEAQPLSIQGMQPVGQYAYSIAFSDGHDTGIFTLELLRSLGTVVEN